MTPDAAFASSSNRPSSCSALGPLAWLGWLATSGGLGANPVEFLNRYLGDWALRFLLIALAVTPLREGPWAGRNWRASAAC